MDLGASESIAELIEAAKAAEARFNHSQVWCRGHANQSWTLVSSAHRRHPVLESQMANHFRIQAPSVSDRCPSHTDYAAWLPFMRHYGVPTRLLDWTESVSVAAFFAINEEPSNDAAIWFLDPGALNKRTIGDQIPFLGATDLEPLVQGAFQSGDVVDLVLAALAPRVEPRMAAQLGAFTIHASPEPLEEIEGCEEFLARVTIPKTARDRFRCELSLLGLRLSTLFPDLHHLAQQVADLRALGPNREDLEQM